MARVSPEQVAAAAYAAGFRGKSLILAVAIAGAESSFDARAVGDVNVPVQGARSLGLWQINTHFHRGLTEAEAFDPRQAAKRAYRIATTGRGFEQWTTYRNEDYKRHLPAARAAAASVTGDRSLLDAIGDASGLAREAVGEATGISDAIAGVRFLTDPQNWARLAYGVIGLVLLVVGVVIVAKDTVIGAVAGDAVGAVVKGAT